MRNCNEIAEQVSAELLKNGFVIQRYDAYSTDSIYLKIDYGVCNSIRISDHPGKRHLKYRYNIGSFVKRPKRERDQFERIYFRAEGAKDLVRQVMKDREEKMRRFGEKRYREFMKKNRCENAGKRGFWSNAKTLNCRKDKNEQIQNAESR